MPETIRHNHIDDLCHVAQVIWQAGHSVEFIKVDFKGAYRTVPIAPEQLDLATLLVRDTDNGQWVTTQQWALPFGAVASVYGWERLGNAVTIILRGIGLPVLRYVDDLFLAVPKETGAVARRVIETVVEALGLTLESSKTEGPVNSLVVLGVLVSCDTQGVFSFKPEGKKLVVWIKAIELALEKDALSPAAASKLAGRLLFARSTFFGKIGSAQLRRIFHRAHKSKTNTLNAPLKRVLVWWKAMLTAGTFYKEIALGDDPRKPCLLYTDATGKGSMGYALYSSDGNIIAWSQLIRPPLCAALLKPRKNQVTAWETLAPVWAVSQEAERLKRRKVHIFIDNEGARFALEKGSSTVDDINGFCGALWALVSQLRAEVTIFRVPTKENAADAPSRGKRPHGAATCPNTKASVSMASGEDLRSLVPIELRCNDKVIHLLSLV